MSQLPEEVIDAVTDLLLPALAGEVSAVVRDLLPVLAGGERARAPVLTGGERARAAVATCLCPRKHKASLSQAQTRLLFLAGAWLAGEKAWCEWVSV